MEYKIKVLITGADGFIGSHLTEALVNNGFNVRAFVCYNSFNSYGWLDSISNEIKNKIEFFTGDIRDPNGVNEAIKGIDIVFH
jgi:dTDP-glucose 4,6-dehydratase